MVETSKISKLLILLCFGIIAGTGVFYSSPSCAQSTAGCASDTWGAMANRAGMEARRQDVMNKSYIVKADSVLQYSCFTDELIRTINETSRIFSNGDQWVGRTVPLIQGFKTNMDIYDPSPSTLHSGTLKGYVLNPGSGTDYKAGYIMGSSTLSFDSMDIAITSVVGGTSGGALFDYINDNFGHTVLSDTTSLTNTGLCYKMADIWKAAECKNFDGIATFYSFENLTGIPNFLTSPDPRQFPSTMPCS